MKKILSISFTFALVLAFAVPQASFAMSTFESSTQTGTEVKTVTIATLQSQIAALTAQLESLKAMLSKQAQSIRPNTNDVYNQAKPITQPTTSHGCAPGEKFDTRTGARCSGATSDSTGVPSIRVISPNGGEILKKGGTYTFTWKSSNVPTVSLMLFSDSLPVMLPGGMLPVNVPNTGSFTWTIPVNLDAPLSLPDSKDYRILVQANDSLGDWSDDKFTITSSGTPTVNADVTGNGIVNIDDLLYVINHWGACPVIDPTIFTVARYEACKADIDHDSTVGQSDMKLVQANWTK